MWIGFFPKIHRYVDVPECVTNHSWLSGQIYVTKISVTEIPMTKLGFISLSQKSPERELEKYI